MVQFSQKETDILVCTTIIEAGLDIPNVNTLIIERADTFGLSQLYQLRGRIGRSSYQAYAYLLIPTSYQLSHIAEKRLQAILSATELGSGFRIAMRDLEIRGAGNLLGSEQSGHINAIGYELYTQILADTVRKLKADPTDYNITQSDTSYGVKITLPLPAFIPSTYINDTSTRLDVYQRLSKESSSHELDNLANELNDRFGNIPEELINLIYIVNIKILAENAGVISISQQNKNTVIHMRSPIEGAKIVLQRELEGLAEVGNLQIRIKNTKMWKYQLVEVIEKLSYFKKFIDTL
jgi:transcription-repair coupling factor (superfamily II helicase)